VLTSAKLPLIINTKCIVTHILGRDLELSDEDLRKYQIAGGTVLSAVGYQGTLLCTICLTDLLQSFTCDNFLWNLLSLEYNFTDFTYGHI
jgi:hypothetical protein